MSEKKIDPAFDALIGGMAAPGDIAAAQEKLDGEIVKEVSSDGVVIMGRKFRKITLASAALLRMIKSPLIQGVVIKDLENPFLDCLKFLVIQSGPIEEARALAADPVKLEAVALEFGENFGFGECATLISQCVGAITESQSTQVKGTPPKEQNKKKGELPGKT